MLGICNGFQVLLEAGLLPGRDAAQPRSEVPLRARRRPRRADRHAVHRSAPRTGQVLQLPIAHGEGQLLRAARRARASSRQPAASSSATATRSGEVDRRGQPERLGSTTSPASATRRRNVVGLMPHPERACEPALGSADGLVLFESVVDARWRRQARSRRHDVPIDHATLDRHGINPDEYDRIVELLRREPNLTELGHLLGDVVRALQLQELARPPEDAADRPARACCRGRARTPAPSTSATGSPRSSRSNRTTIRRSSSRTRARRPASAASSATSSRWARGRSRCSTRCASDRSTARRRADAPHRRRRGRAASAATATASAFRPSAARSRSTRRYARQPARQRALPRHRRGTTRIVKGRRVGRRQSGLLRRRQDRPRRHPWRDDGVGGVRREVGGEAAGRAGRRSVHGEAAARGVPRGDGDRRAASACRTWARPG